MKSFLMLALTLFAQQSFADCPNLQGVYVSVEVPHQSLNIFQNGCNSVNITEDNWAVEGLVDGRKHHSQKLEWANGNTLIETDYYIFGNKADRQVLLQNPDGSIDFRVLDGRGRVHAKFTFKKVSQ